jgi:DNA-binding response OmpR family regulator
MPILPALQNVILYVEDDDASAFLLENCFVETRFRMIRVSSADEAIAFLSRCREDDVAACPVLILLDLHMPVKTGFDMLRELDVLGFALPVAVFSTTQDASERTLALTLGAKWFISKPIDLAGYDQVVDQVTTLASTIH